MKVSKEEVGSADFKRPEDGLAIIKLVTEKTMKDFNTGNPVQKLVIHFKGDADTILNATSKNHLIDGFGVDTNDWVNKQVLVMSVSKVINGKPVNYYIIKPTKDQPTSQTEFNDEPEEEKPPKITTEITTPKKKQQTIKKAYYQQRSDALQAYTKYDKDAVAMHTEDVNGHQMWVVEHI